MSTLDRPVDNASLAVFRIAFGLTIVAWVVRAFATDVALRHYDAAALHFPFVSFVALPSPTLLALEMLALLVAGLGVALGVGFRVCAALVLALFTHLFLADRALYQNHHYLICVVAALLLVSPAHRTFSVDAHLFPRVHADVVPGFSLFVLRAQVALVYAYAGIAKLNADWLVAGEPMRTWLSLSAPEAIVVSWCAAAFDLLVVPALLWRRTRALALAAATVFHGVNGVLWNIDVFPAFMFAATLLWLPSSWPRAVLARLMRRPIPTVAATEHARTPRALVVIFVVHLVVQVALPLRHHAIPGDVAWTDDGHRFSWRMMLRQKLVAARFFAVDTHGDVTVVDHERYLQPWQAYEVLVRPELARDLGRWLAARVEDERGTPVAVHAFVVARVNKHPEKLLLDPRVDLALASPDAPLVTITIAEDDVEGQAAARAFVDELAARAKH